MIAADEADVLHLRAHLDDFGRAFQLEVLDHGDGVAVLQDVPRGVADHGFVRCFGRLRGVSAPFVRALRADEEASVLIGEGGVALGAGRERAHVSVPVRGP